MQPGNPGCRFRQQTTLDSQFSEIFVNTIMNTYAQVRSAAIQAVLILLLSLTSGMALAQDDAPDAGMKIAFLDMAKALFDSDKAKALNEQVQGEVAEDEEKVRSLAQEATALQE